MANGTPAQAGPNLGRPAVLGNNPNIHRGNNQGWVDANATPNNPNVQAANPNVQPNIDPAIQARFDALNQNIQQAQQQVDQIKQQIDAQTPQRELPNVPEAEGARELLTLFEDVQNGRLNTGDPRAVSRRRNEFENVHFAHFEETPGEAADGRSAGAGRARGRALGAFDQLLGRDGQSGLVGAVRTAETGPAGENIREIVEIRNALKEVQAMRDYMSVRHRLEEARAGRPVAAQVTAEEMRKLHAYEDVQVDRIAGQVPPVFPSNQAENIKQQLRSLRTREFAAMRGRGTIDPNTDPVLTDLGVKAFLGRLSFNPLTHFSTEDFTRIENTLIMAGNQPPYNRIASLNEDRLTTMSPDPVAEARLTNTVVGNFETTLVTPVQAAVDRYNQSDQALQNHLAALERVAAGQTPQVDTQLQNQLQRAETDLQRLTNDRDQLVQANPTLGQGGGGQANPNVLQNPAGPLTRDQLIQQAGDRIQEAQRLRQAGDRDGAMDAMMEALAFQQQALLMPATPNVLANQPAAQTEAEIAAEQESRNKKWRRALMIAGVAAGVGAQLALPVLVPWMIGGGIIAGAASFGANILINRKINDLQTKLNNPNNDAAENSRLQLELQRQLRAKETWRKIMAATQGVGLGLLGGGLFKIFLLPAIKGALGVGTVESSKAAIAAAKAGGSSTTFNAGGIGASAGQAGDIVSSIPGTEGITIPAGGTMNEAAINWASQQGLSYDQWLQALKIANIDVPQGYISSGQPASGVGNLIDWTILNHNGISTGGVYGPGEYNIPPALANAIQQVRGGAVASGVNVTP